METYKIGDNLKSDGGHFLRIVKVGENLIGLSMIREKPQRLWNTGTKYPKGQSVKVNNVFSITKDDLRKFCRGAWIFKKVIL